MNGLEGPFKEAANIIVNERLGNKFKKGSLCDDCGCGSCSSCRNKNTCTPVTVPVTIGFELACGTVSSPLYETIGDCGATVTIAATVINPVDGLPCNTILVITRGNGETVERFLPAPVTPGSAAIAAVITVTNVRQISIRCITNGTATGGCTGQLEITTTYCAPDCRSCKCGNSCN